MRFFLIFFFVLKISSIFANEYEKKKENLCIKAVNQKTSYRVSGIYGSPLETEWHPAAAYVLLKEIQRFSVLKREFIQKTSPWRFEFLEMVGGKTVVFVYHKKIMQAFCRGPNSFLVVKK